MKPSLKTMLALLSGLLIVGVATAYPSMQKGKKSGAQASGKTITGTIDMSASMKKTFKGFEPSNVIYVIAYPFEGKSKMPSAVVRIDQLKDKTFPISFTLAESDMMMKGAQGMAGKIKLKAKLSKAGGAMTQPGDIQGFSDPKKPLSLGDTGVKIELSEVAK